MPWLQKNGLPEGVSDDIDVVAVREVDITIVGTVLETSGVVSSVQFSVVSIVTKEVVPALCVPSVVATGKVEAS